jgi:hypothetical protein
MYVNRTENNEKGQKKAPVGAKNQSQTPNLFSVQVQ